MSANLSVESSHRMIQQDDISNPIDGEISLLDIVNFLTGTWKKLAAASIVGAVLGLAGWLTLGSYSAEYVLLNNRRFKHEVQHGLRTA